MSKDNLTNNINLFQRRGEDYLKKKWNDTLLQIQDNLKLLNQAIAANEDAMSVSAWVAPDMEKTPSCTVAPARMRLGRLHMNFLPNAEMSQIDIPLLLPMKAGAIMLNLGTEADKGPALFQNIILRLLMTMRMDLVKVSVVDMDFGSSFPVVSAITNPMFKSEVVYTQEEVTRLVGRLAKEASEANRIFLGRSADIDAYNSSTGDMAQPYHFVFIDDFPNGFTSQTIDGLVRLIENGNARKSGIVLFINYSRKNDAPREFDIRRFSNNCAWVNRDVSGRIWFENMDFKCPKETTVEIELETTEKVGEYVDYINGIKEKQVTYSLDGWVEDLMKNDKVWNESTMEGINVPVGYISPRETFNFCLANDYGGNDFFALIAGRPGYGKTVLLHNIIVHAAMKYSPDELCMYLADFAEGASFSIYRDLPHVKSLMLSNNKEYALRMLEDLVLEAKIRATKYKRAERQFGKQVTKLSEFREVTGENMPRILFVMDEFHTLFLSTDLITIHAKEVLCDGIRQWRKFGISIILCTQSINGVNFGNADTNITYRFALNLLEMDSKSVIRNDAAKTLTRKGQTIMNNTSDGRVDANVEFQSAFSPHYLEYVKYLAELYKQRYSERHVPFICEDGADADIADNATLSRIFVDDMPEVNADFCDVFVGKPDLLREVHTRIRYRRQQGSNTLIIGDDYKTLVYNIAVQLLQIQRQSPEGSKVYLVDSMNPGDHYRGALEGLNNLDDSFLSGYSQNVEQYVNDVYAEFERRKAEQKEGGFTAQRIVLALMNMQNAYELKPQQGKYGLDSTEVVKNIITLLTEGAPFGIHCIFHGLSHNTLFKTSGILDSSKHIGLFENYIFLKDADVGSIPLGGLKVSAPEEEGRLIVINAKIDGEPYEQCSAYSDMTSERRNSTVDFMSNLFETYRYD